MKAIITGATGMIGNLVLRHCLENLEITEVISISRRNCGISNAKLREIIHKDFLSFDSIASEFENIDIAYFCLGAYTGAVSDEVFKKITYSFVVSFSEMLKSKSPNATFCLLSGAGADQTEKSRVAFAKYKGMAENYLLKTFEKTYLLRPGYIYPVEKRKEPNLMYSVSRALYPLLKLAGKKYSIKSTELAEAIFKIGISGADKSILENNEILDFLS